MHIGIITHNYPGAGGKKDAGILIRELARAMAKSAQVSVLHIGKNQKLGTWSVANPLSCLRFIRLIQKETARARRWVENNHIDVVVAMWAMPAGFIAYQLHKETGIPYAVIALGSDMHVYSHIPIIRTLIKKSLQSANIRIANSHFLCREVTKLSGSSCTFIPTATRFPMAKRKHFVLNPKNYHFLFVGRLEKIKGIDVLLEAYSHCSPCDLHVIGDGSMRNKIHGPVISHGPLSQPAVAGYMRAADCIVIPSRHESMPLAFLEAAKSGLPIIASDVGDVGYVTKKYKTGLLFESENVEDLTRKMERMIALGKRAKTIYGPGLRRLTTYYNPTIAPKVLLTSLTRLTP